MKCGSFSSDKLNIFNLSEIHSALKWTGGFVYVAFASISFIFAREKKHNNFEKYIQRMYFTEFHHIDMMIDMRVSSQSSKMRAVNMSILFEKKCLDV